MCFATCSMHDVTTMFDYAQHLFMDKTLLSRCLNHDPTNSWNFRLRTAIEMTACLKRNIYGPNPRCSQFFRNSNTLNNQSELWATG